MLHLFCFVVGAYDVLQADNPCSWGLQVLFMFVLLNSLLRLKSGTIPMTFILQLLLWCNKEIVAQVLVTTGSTTSSIFTLRT